MPMNSFPLIGSKLLMPVLAKNIAVQARSRGLPLTHEEGGLHGGFLGQTQALEAFATS